MLIRKLLFSLLCLLSVHLMFSQTASKPVTLQAGEEHQGALSKKTAHYFNMPLDSGQFVFGHVLQKTVDVAVHVSDPDGKRLKSFDQPARGKELFQFESKAKGDYKIEVAPFKEESGQYAIVISQVAPIASDPNDRVDQLLMAYSGNDVPGAAVMVMKDGDVKFSKAYGMANLAYDIPFEVDSRTNIGSTTKQFTAMAILLLEEQGKLSLEDKVNKYITELPDFEHEVKIKHLLSHTSGYREFLNLLAMTGRNLSTDLDREMMIELVKRQPELQNVPGAEWNYNNTAFALAAEIVERVGEQPFHKWMKEHVFQPLGMESTRVRKHQLTVIPGRTVGYQVNQEGEYIEAVDLAGAAGAGGIYTTLGDLSKWIRNFEDPKIGSDKIFEKMITPFVLNDGDTTEYGYGLFIGEYKGQKIIQHGGADVAHRSMLMYFPEFEGAVITQSNFVNFPGGMAYDIAEVFFSEHFAEKEKKPAAQEDASKEEEPSFEYEAENFDLLTGKYEFSDIPGFILSFDREEERLIAQATGQPQVELKPLSDSLFSISMVNAKVKFHLNEDGSADSLTLFQNGEHKAYKIQWDPSLEDLKEYTGSYFSEEIETYYKIGLEDSTLLLQHYQIDDYELVPADKDAFSGGFPISELAFIRGEKGEIKGFNASNGRTKNVFFDRVKLE